MPYREASAQEAFLHRNAHRHARNDEGGALELESQVGERDLRPAGRHGLNRAAEAGLPVEPGLGDLGLGPGIKRHQRDQEPEGGEEKQEPAEKFHKAFGRVGPGVAPRVPPE